MKTDPQSDAARRPRRGRGPASAYLSVVVTVGHYLLRVPRGLAASTFSWCASLGVRYGYDVATGDRVTLNFATAADRARLLAMVEKQCAAMRPYNPAFAAL